MQIKVFTILAMTLFLFSCRDTRVINHKEWAAKFEQQNIEDVCLIVRDNNHESVHYLNKENCLKRYKPGNTFNMFASLVALETAVANDDQLIINWDSIKRNETWDKNMTLRDAIAHGNTYYFEQLCRRIGMERMRHFLDTTKYGNMELRGNVNTFWQNGSLEISPDEQLGFIKRMYFNELPFAERTQRIVKTMMLKEQDTATNFYYLTAIVPSIDNKKRFWIVGVAEYIQHVKEKKASLNQSDVRNYPYFFSCNYLIDNSTNIEEANKTGYNIIRDILKEYGAFNKR